MTITQAGLEDPDCVVRVNHCLDKEICYKNERHAHCMSYKCKDYKPKHAKNAKIQAKYLLRR